MFEVSWADPRVETVGERKERKAKEAGEESVENTVEKRRETPEEEAAFFTSQQYGGFFRSDDYFHNDHASQPSNSSQRRRKPATSPKAERPPSSRSSGSSSSENQRRYKGSTTFSLGHSMTTKTSLLSLRSNGKDRYAPVNPLAPHPEEPNQTALARDPFSLSVRNQIKSRSREFDPEDFRSTELAFALQRSGTYQSDRSELGASIDEDSSEDDLRGSEEGEDSFHSQVEVKRLPILTTPGTSKHSSWPLTMESSLNSFIVEPSKSIEEREELGPGSFVTRRTEVTVSEDEITDASLALREIHISAHPSSLNKEEAYIDVDGGPISGDRKPLNLAQYRGTATVTTARGKSGNDMSIAADSWSCPQNWEYLPKYSDQASRRTNASMSPTLNGPKSVNRFGLCSLSDAGPVDLEMVIRHMSTMSPTTMLQKLTEQVPELSDSQAYKNLEFEQQLWLLTSLRYVASFSNAGVEIGDRMEVPTSPPVGSTKVLSLYESQSSAAFLASHSSAQETHHISTAPIDPENFPQADVRPYIAPTVNQRRLQFPDKYFSSIYCLPLATVLTSSSIPNILRECNRMLLPNGTLCLTILDPSPLAATTGPKLRAWLQDNLMLPLQESSRCIQPSDLFPRWLGKNGFVYNPLQGSRMKFTAVPQGEGMSEIAELSTMVGRLLWKYIWGGLVVADNWWWEDKGILEECANFDTRWVCHIVDCVKTDYLQN